MQPIGHGPQRTSPADARRWLARVGMLSPFLLLGCFLLHQQALGRYPSDLPDHLVFVEQLEAGHLPLFHKGFHYTVAALDIIPGVDGPRAAAIVLSASLLVTALLCCGFLAGAPGNRAPEAVLLGLTEALLIVTAIYLPWFNRFLYLGQGSPNVWHNPTTILLKPFALASFFLLAPACGPGKLAALGRWRAISAAGLLVLSVWVKPSFALFFIPAVMIFVALQFVCARRVSWGMLLVLAPAAAALAYGCIRTQSSADPLERAKIVFDFLGAARLHTPNVFVSALLVLAFPLAVALCRYRSMTEPGPLQIAWLGLGIAAVQYFCFAEEGARYEDQNLMWGYVVALSLVFICSAREMLIWGAEPERRRGAFLFCIGIFAAHFASGLYYLGRILMGGPVC